MRGFGLGMGVRGLRWSTLKFNSRWAVGLGWENIKHEGYTLEKDFASSFFNNLCCLDSPRFPVIYTEYSRKNSKTLCKLWTSRHQQSLPSQPSPTAHLELNFRVDHLRPLTPIP